MGQFSSFDELPTIVHDGILRSLASPSDVANTIRASSGALQAYVTGSRSVVLVSAMRNFLSLENQHLMNLVIAAPDYYNHGRAKSDTVDFGESRSDFDRAVHHFLRSFDSPNSAYKYEMQHLTLNTFDSSIRVYAIMDNAIRTYALYTLARAQRRVNELSGPQILRSLLTGPSQPAPDDQETQRLWRGFLLYELFCITCGMPLISAETSNDRHHRAWREVAHTVSSFHSLSEIVLEEFLCIRSYVIEQYQLAVNEMWESFRLNVTGMGRCASSGKATAQELGKTSAFELTPDEFPTPVKYLLEGTTLEGTTLNPSYGYNWTDSVAMLGVRFLQEFLSQDQTARLDFFNATHPFLHKELIPKKCLLFQCHLGYEYRSEQHFGRWDRVAHNDACHTLRAVGWIFWQSPDRIAAMDLVPHPQNATYMSLGGIPPHLGLRDRSFLVEKAIEPEDWVRIVREFGSTITKNQRRQIKRLFRSIGNLKLDEVTRIVTDGAIKTRELSRTKPRTAVADKDGTQRERKLAATASAPEALWDNLLTLWDDLLDDNTSLDNLFGDTVL